MTKVAGDTLQLSSLLGIIKGDERSPQPILGQRYSMNCKRDFPESVHILGMLVLCRLICMVFGRGSPGVEFKVRLMSQ